MRAANAWGQRCLLLAAALQFRSGGQHGCDRLRVERPSALVQEATSRQFRRYCPEAQLPAFRLLSCQRLRQFDDVGPCLGMALAPLNFHAGRDALPLPRCRELRDSVAFSNCATAPSTWRTRTAVGVSSTKNVGADAAMSVIPFALSMSWPASCTMRSRAKRSGLSTRIDRAPLLRSRSSILAKPGRSSTRSAPLTAAS